MRYCKKSEPLVNFLFLMLTAKDAAEDRFSGFELGADDYLIKPFLPKELLLRVQAILKRSYPTGRNEL